MKDRSILALELLRKKTKFSLPIYKLIKRKQTKKMQAALHWLSQCFKETKVCQVPVSQQGYISLSCIILTVLLDQVWVNCKKRVNNLVQKEKSWAGEGKPQILQWSRCSDTRWSQPVSLRWRPLNPSHGSSASCPHNSQKKDKQILPLQTSGLGKSCSVLQSISEPSGLVTHQRRAQLYEAGLPYGAVQPWMSPVCVLHLLCWLSMLTA